jgi:hypothetical protein
MWTARESWRILSTSLGRRIMARVVLSVRVDPELLEAVEKAAAERGDPDIGPFVRDCLTRELGASADSPGLLVDRLADNLRLLRRQLAV